jgi:hypothetical protein
MTQIVRAQARRGRKGPDDIILLLPNGKIAFPRGFTPREWEWYDVELLEDRDRYAVVRLHQHSVGESGICVACGRTVDYRKLEAFARQWLGNLLNETRIKKIKETEALVFGYFDTLIGDLDEMIGRLDKMAEPHKGSVNMCPPGYPTVDSCFADLCSDEECLKLEAAIVYLERIREELAERRRGATRALEYDIMITVTPFGIERIFVPGI